MQENLEVFHQYRKVEEVGQRYRKLQEQSQEEFTQLLSKREKGFKMKISKIRTKFCALSQAHYKFQALNFETGLNSYEEFKELYEEWKPYVDEFLEIMDEVERDGDMSDEESKVRKCEIQEKGKAAVGRKKKTIQKVEKKKEAKKKQTTKEVIREAMKGINKAALTMRRLH